MDKSFRPIIRKLNAMKPIWKIGAKIDSRTKKVR